MGRRMCSTAANLIEYVLPEVALRQWVLTFPFAWKSRLAQDGAALGALTRVFVRSVEKLYARRSPNRHGKTGAVTVVQRTSSDMRLNPQLHTVFLDGAYREDGEGLAWDELSHLRTREVGEVLESTVRGIRRYLERNRLMERAGGDGDDDACEMSLAASAVSGREPPAGPQWLRGLTPLSPSALAFDKPLCASLDGFTLHAATRAGALDVIGREALLRYVLRPPLAQERVELRPDGLARISLSARTRTAPSRSTWTRYRSSVGWRRASRRRACTR
jgi:hypothetical protein